MPDRYTHGHADVVVRSHATRTVENSCGYLLEHLHPGLSLLDVGCGPGSITADLAERVAPGRVRGVEVVPEPLERARATAAERGVDAEPDAGRRLLGWVHAAGFTDVTPSASVWCYATPEERTAWGGMWADRIHTGVGATALERGLATESDLNEIEAGWRAWTAHPDAWFAIPHGEVLARV